MPDELLQRILSVLGGGGGGHQQEAEDGGVHGVTIVTLSRVITVSRVSTLSRVSTVSRVTCHAVYQLAGVCMAVWSRHGPGTDWSAEMGTGALYPGHCFHHPSAVTEPRRVHCPVHTVQIT